MLGRLKDVERVEGGSVERAEDVMRVEGGKG